MRHLRGNGLCRLSQIRVRCNTGNIYSIVVCSVYIRHEDIVMELKLLDRVRLQARAEKYGLHTERSYVNWNKRFILFHGKRHPETMGLQEVA